MDGIAATRAIRARAPAAEGPYIIALTANALAGHRELCLSAGMNDFLTKPVTRPRLEAALARAIAPAAGPAPPAAASPAIATQAAAHTLRILVADDNPVNRSLARAQFSSLGYEIDVAADGAEAVAAVSRQPYDLLFMDLRMPNMDGIEATRRITAMTDLPVRPRIFGMTASGDDSDRKRCLAAGMESCVVKPVASAELAALLATCERPR
jgi:two-component system sensor histidine kinase/response regulator